MKQTKKGKKKTTKTTNAQDLPMGSQTHKDETLIEKDPCSIENDFHGYGCIKSYTEVLMVCFIPFTIVLD